MNLKFINQDFGFYHTHFLFYNNVKYCKDRYDYNNSIKINLFLLSFHSSHLIPLLNKTKQGKMFRYNYLCVYIIQISNIIQSRYNVNLAAVALDSQTETLYNYLLDNACYLMNTLSSLDFFFTSAMSKYSWFMNGIDSWNFYTYIFILIVFLLNSNLFIV